MTLYPFVLMDIAAGNALTDPWTGAASQPAYPVARTDHLRSGARARPARPTGRRAAAAQVDAFFGAGNSDAWGYRRMVLHYAKLAGDARAACDAFLIGSELRG